MVKDPRWETRLLALVAAILVVFGLTAVYGASSLLTISGGQVGSSFALKQALGAAVGGIVAALLSRSDYRKWQGAAWPVLAVVAVLLLLPLLPFTYAIAPSINGARRWVNLGFVTLQPSELAKFAVVVWTPIPTSFSRRSARSGAFSGCSRSSCCSARSHGSASAARSRPATRSAGCSRW